MALGNILVTGGSGGLGRHLVETLLNRGARVAFTYCRAGEAAQALARASEGRARAYALDLADAAAAQLLVEQLEDDLGPLDGLVNNAAVCGDSLLAMTSDEDWAQVIDVNLGGAFRCCRAVLPGMIRRRRGAIVNVASLSARHGVAGQTSYAASKAGVLGLTRALAREVGRRGIRVNAVAPGFLVTAMTAALSEELVHALRQRECLPGGVEPRSVAETVAFLLSPAASSITGQCIYVDAGVSA